MVVVEMETVKLEQIVIKWFPDMLPFFKQQELDSIIMLRDGFKMLEQEDAMEIMQYSICEHQNTSLLH